MPVARLNALSGTARAMVFFMSLSLSDQKAKVPLSNNFRKIVSRQQRGEYGVYAPFIGLFACRHMNECDRTEAFAGMKRELQTMCFANFLYDRKS